jgi:hypothetical protein
MSGHEAYCPAATGVLVLCTCGAVARTAQRPSDHKREPSVGTAAHLEAWLDATFPDRLEPAIAQVGGKTF